MKKMTAIALLPGSALSWHIREAQVRNAATTIARPALSTAIKTIQGNQ